MRQRFFYSVALLMVCLFSLQTGLLEPWIEKQQKTYQQYQTAFAVHQHDAAQSAYVAQHPHAAQATTLARTALEEKNRQPWVRLPSIFQDMAAKNVVIIEDIQFQRPAPLPFLNEPVQAEQLDVQIRISTFLDSNVYDFWQNVRQDIPAAVILRSLDIQRVRESESIDFDKIRMGEIPKLFSATLTFRMLSFRENVNDFAAQTTP